MEGHKILSGNAYFCVTIDKNGCAECQKCGHLQASNVARMLVYYRKCLKDSAANPKHVVLARNAQGQITF